MACRVLYRVWLVASSRTKCLHGMFVTVTSQACIGVLRPGRCNIKDGSTGFDKLIMAQLKSCTRSLLRVGGEPMSKEPNNALAISYPLK